jgi:hypothetical protein
MTIYDDIMSKVLYTLYDKACSILNLQSNYIRRNVFLARVVWYLWRVLYGICGVYV